MQHTRPTTTLLRVYMRDREFVVTDLDTGMKNEEDPSMIGRTRFPSGRGWLIGVWTHWKRGLLCCNTGSRLGLVFFFFLGGPWDQQSHWALGVACGSGSVLNIFRKRNFSLRCFFFPHENFKKGIGEQEYEKMDRGGLFSGASDLDNVIKSSVNSL